MSTGGSSLLVFGPLIASVLLSVGSWRLIFVVNLSVVLYVIVEMVRNGPITPRARNLVPGPVDGLAAARAVGHGPRHQPARVLGTGRRGGCCSWASSCSPGSCGPSCVVPTRYPVRGPRDDGVARGVPRSLGRGDRCRRRAWSSPSPAWAPRCCRSRPDDSPTRWASVASSSLVSSRSRWAWCSPVPRRPR